MVVRLTERDRRMLVKCALCRWLTTDQLKRLYFPEATLNAVQKRLRKLADAGYLRSYREHPTAESLHAIGPKGKPLVEEQGVEVAAACEAPAQTEHLVGVNELRLAVERNSATLAYCFAYWQLADLGWRYPVIPDLVFAVRGPERRAYAVEFDRGTEPLGKLLEKLRRYEAGLEGFPVSAVLVVAEEMRRFDLLASAVRDNEFAGRFLFSTIGEAREAGVFGTEFVEPPGGTRRRILDSDGAEPEE